MIQKFVFIFLLSIAFLQLNGQNSWTVIASGTPNAGTPDPNFAPQHLTIEVGDTVVWQNTQGHHDISMTTGPVDFSYGPAGSGWTHQFVFTVVGQYNYECSVGTHAITQFGTINVTESSVSTRNLAFQPAVKLFPNPATSFFSIEWEAADQLANVQLLVTDLLGKTTYFKQIENGKFNQMIDLTKFTSGTYSISLLSDQKRVWSSSLQVVK